MEAPSGERRRQENRDAEGVKWGGVVGPPNAPRLEDLGSVVSSPVESGAELWLETHVGVF